MAPFSLQVPIPIAFVAVAASIGPCKLRSQYFCAELETSRFSTTWPPGLCGFDLRVLHGTLKEHCTSLYRSYLSLWCIVGLGCSQLLPSSVHMQRLIALLKLACSRHFRSCVRCSCRISDLTAYRLTCRVRGRPERASAALCEVTPRTRQKPADNALTEAQTMRELCSASTYRGRTVSEDSRVRERSTQLGSDMACMHANARFCN